MVECDVVRIEGGVLSRAQVRHFRARVLHVGDLFEKADRPGPIVAHVTAQFVAPVSVSAGCNIADGAKTRAVIKRRADVWSVVCVVVVICAVVRLLRIWRANGLVGTAKTRDFESLQLEFRATAAPLVPTVASIMS